MRTQNSDTQKLIEETKMQFLVREKIAAYQKIVVKEQLASSVNDFFRDIIDYLYLNFLFSDSQYYINRANKFTSNLALSYIKQIMSYVTRADAHKAAIIEKKEGEQITYLIFSEDNDKETNRYILKQLVDLFRKEFTEAIQNKINAKELISILAHAKQLGKSLHIKEKGSKKIQIKEDSVKKDCHKFFSLVQDKTALSDLQLIELIESLGNAFAKEIGCEFNEKNLSVKTISFASFTKNITGYINIINPPELLETLNKVYEENEETKMTIFSELPEKIYTQMHGIDIYSRQVACHLNTRDGLLKSLKEYYKNLNSQEEQCLGKLIDCFEYKPGFFDRMTNMEVPLKTVDLDKMLVLTRQLADYDLSIEQYAGDIKNIQSRYFSVSGSTSIPRMFFKLEDIIQKTQDKTIKTTLILTKQQLSVFLAEKTKAQKEMYANDESMNTQREKFKQLLADYTDYQFKIIKDKNKLMIYYTDKLTKDITRNLGKLLDALDNSLIELGCKKTDYKLSESEQGDELTIDCESLEILEKITHFINSQTILDNSKSEENTDTIICKIQ